MRNRKPIRVIISDYRADTARWRCNTYGIVSLPMNHGVWNSFDKMLGHRLVKRIAISYHGVSPVRIVGGRETQ